MIDRNGHSRQVQDVKVYDGYVDVYFTARCTCHDNVCSDRSIQITRSTHS